MKSSILTGSGGVLLYNMSHIIIIIIININIKAICNAQDPPRRPQTRCQAVRKCSCLYTMYHMNNNIFSCHKGRETTVRHSQCSGQAIPHRRSGYSRDSISVACVCPCNSYPLSVGLLLSLHQNDFLAAHKSSL